MKHLRNLKQFESLEEDLSDIKEVEEYLTSLSDYYRFNIDVSFNADGRLMIIKIDRYKKTFSINELSNELKILKMIEHKYVPIYVTIRVTTPDRSPSFHQSLDAHGYIVSDSDFCDLIDHNYDIVNMDIKLKRV